MADKRIKDIAASTRERLLNYAKSKDENYNAILMRFFQERFVARLGLSKYKKHLILKGGFLLLSQHVTPFRPTVDIDMLGIRVNQDPEALRRIIQEIASIELPDGVTFESKDMTSSVIKEDAEYEGLRFTFTARLGVIKSKMQIDIGFDDAVPGGFIDNRRPTILEDSEFPAILHYPFESIIAEKLQAIVYLGYANSRMKDFYDILFLASNNTFSSKRLKKAIAATFRKRETDLQNRFFIYNEDYKSSKAALWNAFQRKIQMTMNNDFENVLEKLQAFIEPVLTKTKSEMAWQPDLWTWTEL